MVIDPSQHLKYEIDGFEWGTLKVARPLAIDNDIWGCFRDLKDSFVGTLIPTVSGEHLSEALYGNPFPLLNTLGPPPKEVLRKFHRKQKQWACQDSKACIIYDKRHCYPCPKLPACYRSPQNGPIGFAEEIVIALWVQGFYVVLVEGPEYSYE